MRRRRFHTLASQITALAAIPTAAILLGVVGLTLFLNQHSRLDTLLQTDAGLAAAVAGPAATALAPVLVELSHGPGASGLAAEFGADDGIDRAFAAEAAAAARATAARARPDRPALSDVLQGSATTGPFVLAASVSAAGTGRIAAVSVRPGIGSLAWHRAIERALPEAPGVSLALVDANGVVAYHDDPRQITLQIVRAAAASDSTTGHAGGAFVRDVPEGPQRITAFAPLPGSDWTIVTERIWQPWLEAFRGLGVVVLPPLLLAAFLPVLLIALVAGRSTRPIRRLASAAERIAAGDFRPIRFGSRTGDELEVLADRFADMATQLETLYGSLESQVEIRTAELQAVLDLAQAIGSRVQVDEIAELTEAQLARHPAIRDAWLWLDDVLAHAADATRAIPTWVAIDDLRAGRQARGDGSESLVAIAIGRGGTQRAVPLRVRHGAATLAVRLTGDAHQPDLDRFLMAAAAPVATSIDNALLFRREQGAAALAERTRLARELHDTLAQTLTGVVVHLEAARRLPAGGADADHHLTQADALARAGLQDARRSVQGLRPAALDGRTLATALREATARLGATQAVRARFMSQGDSAAVPAPIAAELYRIGEEALTNIVRHAQAAHVLVNLRVTPTDVRLVVEDDGVGIDTGGDDVGGFGLIGMRERAERVGGRLVLASDPGDRTHVEVVVPLGRAAVGAGDGRP